MHKPLDGSAELAARAGLLKLRAPLANRVEINDKSRGQIGVCFSPRDHNSAHHGLVARMSSKSQQKW